MSVDELNRSVEAGSGIVLVVGPAGSGKTHAVLQQIRLRQLQCTEGATQRTVTRRSMRAIHRCYVPLASAAALEGGLLSALAPFLQLHLLSSGSGGSSEESGATFSMPTTTVSANLLSLGGLLQRFLEDQPDQSELHLVLDDADTPSMEVGVQVPLLLQAAHPIPLGKCLLIWCISRTPIRISPCYRYHFFPKPSPEMLERWMVSRALPSQRVEDDNSAESAEPAAAATTVASVVRHYKTKKPMSTSVAASDIRILLHHVSMLLPSLVAASSLEKTSAASHHHKRPRPSWNDLDYSRAWKAVTVDQSDDASSSGNRSELALLESISTLGVSAKLVTVAAFYCGAVSPSMDARVLEPSCERRVSSKAQRADVSILKSSIHTVHKDRWMDVYRHLVDMINVSNSADDDDDDEPRALSPMIAAHYIRSLVEWGLVSQVGGRWDAFHCHITLSTANALSASVGIKLMNLIPNS